MNIQILDSWLRQHLKTRATPKDIAEKLSLTSVGIEHVDKWKDDFLYDIEITTNRVDLANVIGIAREASAVLPQAGIQAEFIPPILPKQSNVVSNSGEATTSIGSSKKDAGHSQNDKQTFTIKNDPKLIDRICAVVMEVEVKPSPQVITDRLEAAGIRSLNNLIDITNYVMREIGHPTHVFDFDRLNTQTLNIREAKKGEVIATLDGKTHNLLPGDIVATDDNDKIIDLISIMGLENSVVTNQTKRILFFIDHAQRHHVRKTSMRLGIRTEAAQINEKTLDPELAYDALLLGIKLYQQHANAKIISEIIDIYPNKVKTHEVSVDLAQINQVIGVDIPAKKSMEILDKLGFSPRLHDESITVTVPSFRIEDVTIPEDIIEEVARVYGYHNIPTKLPAVATTNFQPITQNPFYWDKRVKDAFKYWGFTEVYTYSMVSEEMYDGPIEDAVEIANPLNEDFVFMRSSLILSLLQVLNENKKRDTIKIFEIANVYKKQKNDLPTETRMLAGVIKKQDASFYEVKGLIEQVAADMGITMLSFKPADEITNGAHILLADKAVGTIEILDDEVVNFEVNFDELVNHASTRKVYTPLAKYPPVIEDISVILPDDILTGDVIAKIQKQSKLIKEVTLLDRYKHTRTFHIVYQDQEKNLTSEDIAPIRLKLTHMLHDTFNGEVKE